MGWLWPISHAALAVARPVWAAVDRQLLSDFAGTASFGIWLLAQTPQIYENYARGSVSGLSPFFLIQWMFGDLTNLIGAVLTHQLFFQVALATYFCSIDTVLLAQFWYYSQKESGQDASPRPISIEEAERLLEEQLPSPVFSPTHSRRDSASIRTTSTRSRWAYHSMRQGSATNHERSASKGERSRSLSARRRQGMTSNTTASSTAASSVRSAYSSHDEAQPRSTLPQHHSHHNNHHHHHHQALPTTSLLASTSSMSSATYRALSQAAMSVAQLADEAAAVRRGRSRDAYRGADGRSGSRAPDVARASVAQRSRSERNAITASPSQPQHHGRNVGSGLRAIFAQDEEGDQGQFEERQRRSPLVRASSTFRQASRSRERESNTRRGEGKMTSSQRRRRSGEGTGSSGDDGGPSKVLHRSDGSEAADRSGSASDSPSDLAPSPSPSDGPAGMPEQEAGLLASVRSLRSDASAESSSSSSNESRFGYGFPSMSVADMNAAASGAALESGATIRPWVSQRSPEEEVGRVEEAGSPVPEEYVRPSLNARRTNSRPSRPRTKTGHMSHLSGGGGGGGTGGHARQGSSADPSLPLSASQTLASLHPNSTRSPTAARAGAGMVLLSMGMLFAVGQQVPGRRAAVGRAGGRGSSGMLRWVGDGLVDQLNSALRSDVDWDQVGLRFSEQDGAESTSPLRTILGPDHKASDASVLSSDQDFGRRSFGSDLVRRSTLFDSSHKREQQPGVNSDQHEESPKKPSPPTKYHPKEKIDWEQLIGRSSAWTCTVLYLTSRLPQIWSNHMRKSVEGLSMLLFVAAFLGNLFYTISILANPKAGDWWTLLTGGNGGGGGGGAAGGVSVVMGTATLTPEQKTYLRESLPFLIGSFGASFFDVTILSQWYTFRV
ncbi:unnamed protein product [Tilletia controversa]|nr:hypothetical protein CF335_g5785 [Tilletia laevis]CAD6964697.1 unnamed protein product [Tilletia controversa]CAD6985734.1 unnamed protein product [Tilletia controversa]